MTNSTRDPRSEAEKAIAASSATPRWTMSLTESPLERLAVTQCLRAPDGYRCAPAKTDPSALQAELERLRKENAELRSQLSQPGPGLRPDQRTKPPQPTDQEIDRALDVMDRFLRRFMGILRDEKPDRT